MKRSQVVAVSLVALMMFAALPFQGSRAAGAYSEKLDVFVAGSNALWYMTFHGINGSARLTTFESAPGLGWYNLTAIRTGNWQPDFQVFGPQGYNLLPVPFVPPDGLFLTVGSDSYADALSAVNALDSYMLAAFVSLSNGTGSFTFYSPLSFNAVVPSTLLTFVPYSAGGFASAIKSSGIKSTISPIVTLDGVKSSSGFDHSLVVGSITNKALDTENRPNILGYFGSTTTSLVAASKSTSSLIEVKFLDGLVSSRDSASVTNDISHFTGSYSLNLPLGNKVHLLNATVLQQPVQVLATRLVDAGVLQHGANVSVSVSLTNLSNSTAVTNLSGTDAWWDTSMFNLVRGSSAISYTSIAPGATVTPTYVLQYTGTTTGVVTIPPASVKYSFSVGLSIFNGTARTNPVVLSLGNQHAVLVAYVAPTGGYNKPVGAEQNSEITLKNVGTQTASSVTVAGQHVSGILPGSTALVTVSLSSAGFLGTNVTKSYTVQYDDLEAAHLTATTNALLVLFSHTSMAVGDPQLVVGAELTPLKTGGTNLTLAFATTNLGRSNITSFTAHSVLPSGIGCGTVSGSGATCSLGQLSLNYPSVAPQSTKHAYLKFNVTTPLNYFFGAISFAGASAGLNLTGRSTAIAVPTGIVLSKTFTPSRLFGGMTSRVVIQGINSGPFDVYNATISSSADAFDSISSSAAPSATAHIVAPGSKLNASYGVTASSTASGNLTASPVSSTFFFGSESFILKGSVSVVSVYSPPVVSITTSPVNPTEGKSFTLNVGISNPSGVNVTNVLFTLPVPSGLGISQLQNAQLSGGVLSISLGQMGARSVYNATGSAVASSGITVPFDKAKFTFVYSSVTVSGKLPKGGILIGEDVTTRYLLPTALVFLALVATAYYMRRKTAPSVPASPK